SAQIFSQRPPFTVNHRRMNGPDSIESTATAFADRAGKRGNGRLRLALRAAALAFVAAAALFAGGFGWFANHVSHLATPESPEKADAIIVLTGGISRLDAALNLLETGKGKRLLISGVHPSATRRQLQIATGGDKALFSCCIDIDHAALDTIGNAEESAKWVDNHAYGSIILVTNNYHMPRSLLEMGRAAAGAVHRTQQTPRVAGAPRPAGPSHVAEQLACRNEHTLGQGQGSVQSAPFSFCVALV